MEQLALGILEKSKTKVIAEGVNGFKIELIEKIGSDDIAQLIEVSEVKNKEVEKHLSSL